MSWALKDFQVTCVYYQQTPLLIEWGTTASSAIPAADLFFWASFPRFYFFPLPQNGNRLAGNDITFSYSMEVKLLEKYNQGTIHFDVFKVK